jgi:hypothetical protein
LNLKLIYIQVYKEQRAKSKENMLMCQYANVPMRESKEQRAKIKEQRATGYWLLDAGYLPAVQRAWR